MSYTNAWTDTIPLGSEAASHIDDFMRQIRLDIHERMNDLVVDWTADPVVLKTIASGNVSRYIPPSAFQSATFGFSTPNNFIVQLNTDGPVIAPLSSLIPFNATITKVKYWFDRGTSNSVTCVVRSIPFGAGSYVNTDIGATSISTSTGGIQVLDTGTISVALDSTKMYDLYISGSGESGHSISVYGAFVTFTI